MKIRDLLMILGTTALLSSCGNYIDKKSTTDDGGNSANSILSFETLQNEIFARGSAGHCVDCHQQYSSYSGVKLEINAIANAINSNRMPKTGTPLSDNLKSLLQRWIEAGAPEFAGQSPDNGSQNKLEPNWKSISDNIITPRCLVCHNPNGQAKFLDLSTRLSIYSARSKLFGIGSGKKKLLDLDNPSNSYLLDIILDLDEPMPPIWSNIRRLNNDEIQALINWIGLGLP